MTMLFSTRRLAVGICTYHSTFISKILIWRAFVFAKPEVVVTQP